YNLASLTYHRQVSGQWSVRLEATSTTHTHLERASQMKPKTIHHDRSIDKENINNIISRGGYYLFDVAASYRFFTKHNHEVSAFAGLSMAYSHNLYLKDVMPFRAPTEWTYEAYSGSLGGLRYDYLLCQDRLNIGFEVLGRYYFGDFPFQLNYGLRVGYNF